MTLTLIVAVASKFGAVKLTDVVYFVDDVDGSVPSNV